jgi:hypothetical protein
MSIGKHIIKGQEYSFSPQRSFEKKTHSLSLIPVASLSPALGGTTPNPKDAWQNRGIQLMIKHIPGNN